MTSQSFDMLPIYAYLTTIKGRYFRCADHVTVRAGRSGDQISVGGEIFLTRPDWPWGPPSLLASYTMGTGSFPEIKRPGRGADHSPHLATRLKKE